MGQDVWVPIEPDRPLATALDRVGDRWALLIVETLLDGPSRFNDLQQAVAGIATNVLAQRLRHLETTGVVVARPYSERPLRYEYDLTEAGRNLAGPLRLLAQWGALNPGGGHGAEGASAPASHSECGTPLEARWWCPTCDRVVDAGESEPVVYL
jgi:DNA-binding HxlR family transcriptional regulator